MKRRTRQVEDNELDKVLSVADLGVLATQATGIEGNAEGELDVGQGLHAVPVQFSSDTVRAM